MRKLKNFLNEARQRRINRPGGLMFPEIPVAKKEPEKIDPYDLKDIVKNYNEYAKIPNLITV